MTRVILEFSVLQRRNNVGKKKIYNFLLLKFKLTNKLSNLSCIFLILSRFTNIRTHIQILEKQKSLKYDYSKLLKENTIICNYWQNAIKHKRVQFDKASIYRCICLQVCIYLIYLFSFLPDCNNIFFQVSHI